MAFGNYEKNYQQNIYEQYLKVAKKQVDEQSKNPVDKMGNLEGANSINFNPFSPVNGSSGISNIENLNQKQGLVSRLDKLDQPPVDTRTETEGKRLYLMA